MQHVLDVALAWACLNHHFDVAEYLLDHGADINTDWGTHEPASILHECVVQDDLEGARVPARARNRPNAGRPAVPRNATRVGALHHRQPGDDRTVGRGSADDHGGRLIEFRRPVRLAPTRPVPGRTR